MIFCPNVSQNTKVITSLMMRFYNMLFLFSLCRKEVVLTRFSCHSPCHSLQNLHFIKFICRFNCSWPLSIFSKLILETCTHVQVELSVRNELRQGMGVDSFSRGVKSPISLLHTGQGRTHCSTMMLFQLFHHHIVLYQMLAVLWLLEEGNL